MAAVGASRPLRRIPAIVSFLNPQPALSLVGGNRSSCPEPALRRVLRFDITAIDIKPIIAETTAYPLNAWPRLAQR
jgi:hypothetical protein